MWDVLLAPAKSLLRRWGWPVRIGWVTVLWLVPWVVWGLGPQGAGYWEAATAWLGAAAFLALALYFQGALACLLFEQTGAILTIAERLARGALNQPVQLPGADALA